RANSKAAAGPARTRLGESRSSYISLFPRELCRADARAGEAWFRAAGTLLRRRAGRLGRANSGAAGGRHRGVLRRGSRAGGNGNRFLTPAVAFHRLLQNL